jgi:nanoRNase/pAp phosphatase (c-di-AMP/oligoRNAs hydrolase)
MSLEPQEQFKNFLEKSKDILILLPQNPGGDAIGSAWGLYFFLEKTGKTPTIAFSNGTPLKLDFLPKPENILHEITGARDFVLSFNTSQNKIRAVRSEQKGEQFNIYITPEKGTIDPRDFSFILAKFKYDLIVVIDSPDLEKLGKIYEKNTDLFFEVPVINIDHQSNNDNFGQINLVDVTASSSSEIIYTALENIALESIDEKIARCFLTGIIIATDRFQNKKTTPRAFLFAAKLMDKGADQQEIIRWLYKTQPLNILKTWGRAMAKLNWNEEIKLIWSSLSVEDFVQSRSAPEIVPLILEKLQENYSEGKIFLLLYNDTPSSCVAVLKTADEKILSQTHLVLGGTIRNNLLEINLTSGNTEEMGKIIQEKLQASQIS